MSLWSLVAVGAQAEITAAGTLTLAEPAGVASGDLMVACIVSRTAAVPTIPAGWTNVASQASGNNTVNTTASIASGRMDYIVRGGSAPALGWAWGAADIARGAILAYRRTDGGVPVFDQASSSTLGAASVTQSTATITTVEEDELLIMAECAARGATNPCASNARATDPAQADWTEHTDVGSTGGSDAGLAISSAIKATAGATGTFNWTAALSARGVTIVGAFRAKFNVKANVGSFPSTGQSVDNPAGVKHSFLARGETDSTLGFTTTSASVPFGAANADRIIAIGVGGLAGDGVGVVNSITIGGVAATLINQQNDPVEGVVSSLWWANVPTGTSGNIVVTWSTSAAVNGHIHGLDAYRITGSDTASPIYDQDSIIEIGGDGVVSVSVDVPRFGVMIAATFGRAYLDDMTTVWTGVSEDIDLVFDSTTMVMSSGSYWSGALENGRSIQSDDVGVTAGIDTKALNVASFKVASGAISIAADVGSFTYTGQTAGLFVGRVLTAGQGSYTLSGQAAILRQDLKISAAFGSFTYTGQDAGLSKGITLPADFGLFSYSGFDAILSPHRHWVWEESSPASDSWSEAPVISSSWTEEPPISDTWTEET